MNNKYNCNNNISTNIDSFPVAMAYVPWQYWGKVYEADKGLRQGTIFPELDKPYIGCKRR